MNASTAIDASRGTHVPAFIENGYTYANEADRTPGFV